MKPFVRRTLSRDRSVSNMRALNLGYSETEIERIVDERMEFEAWTNDEYRVLVRDGGDGFIHLAIMRLDGAPVRDWRSFQEIKDFFLGEECEAAELFPAQSRLADSDQHQYHLFGSRDPAYRFPFGFPTGGPRFGDDGDSNDVSAGAQTQ